MSAAQPSAYRVAKQRAEGIITLTSGAAVAGCFFLADASPTVPGRERVAELLNAESGFFPFEEANGRAVLYNRDHVVTVQVSDDEVRRDSGYSVATERPVSLLLTNGHHLRGSIRVHRPEGRDRLSDWARHGERFRYVETGDATFIVNIDHVVDAREAS